MRVNADELVRQAFADGAIDLMTVDRLIAPGKYVGTADHVLVRIAHETPIHVYRGDTLNLTTKDGLFARCRVEVLP